VIEDDRPWCQVELALAHGRLWTNIIDVATQQHVDVSVMGVHGRNIAGLALFESTTNQVARHGRHPVLTLRP
jgi:nucleotide-binding universal stress UspA family protein